MADFVEVPLQDGFVALVDAIDADRVMTRRWSAVTRNRTTYAEGRFPAPDGRSKTGGMHTFLTGNSLTDHINGNGLDNQRANLREATPAQNQHNKRMQKNNTSGFKGVTWNKQRRRWMARMETSGVQRYLGLYTAAEDAALAYDAAARAAWGDFAALNFPRPGERHA